MAEALENLPVATRPAVAVVRSRDLATGLAELTRLAIDHSPLLCIHSGVVAGRDGFLAFPGHSGVGKTTLTAALVEAGFAYVSDEALAIDRETGRITPFPRPLAIGADVWSLFWPWLGVAPADLEQLVSPTALGSVHVGSGEVSDVILLRRRAGMTRLSVGDRGDAVAALLARSFNHFRQPERSFRAVVALIRQARVWNAEYENANALAALIAERLVTIPSDG